MLFTYLYIYVILFPILFAHIFILTKVLTKSQETFAFSNQYCIIKKEKEISVEETQKLLPKPITVLPSNILIGKTRD